MLALGANFVHFHFDVLLLGLRRRRLVGDAEQRQRLSAGVLQNKNVGVLESRKQSRQSAGVSATNT